MQHVVCYIQDLERQLKDSQEKSKQLSEEKSQLVSLTNQ